MLNLNGLWIESWSWSESHVSIICTWTSAPPMHVENLRNNISWSLYILKWVKKYTPQMLSLNGLLIEIWSWIESRVSTICTETSASLMQVKYLANNISWSLHTFKWIKYIYIPPKCWVWMNCELKFEVELNPMFPPSAHEYLHLQCMFKISEIFDHYTLKWIKYIYILPKCQVWMECNLKLNWIPCFHCFSIIPYISDAG